MIHSSIYNQPGQRLSMPAADNTADGRLVFVQGKVSYFIRVYFTFSFFHYFYLYSFSFTYHRDSRLQIPTHLYTPTRIQTCKPSITTDSSRALNNDIYFVKTLTSHSRITIIYVPTNMRLSVRTPLTP